MSQAKIMPITKNWNEGERDWSYVKDARLDIEQWEAASGKKLPNDDRRFMLKFNGGRVYPSLFQHNEPNYFQGPTFLEIFYDWAYVQHHFEGKEYGAGTPADFLIIGGDPGGLQVLLSCRDEDAGQIFCWVHKTIPWGDEDNRDVWHQANSFSELVTSLYEDESGTSHDHWYIPLCDSLARPLQF